MVAVLIVVVFAVVKPHLIGVDGAGGGVVHIDPAGAEAARSELFGVPGPPLADFVLGEVGEDGFAGPDEADIGVTFACLTEGVVFQAVVIDVVARVLFDAGVDDRDDSSTGFGEFVSGFLGAVGELFFADGEDAVVAHVVEVEP